MVLGTPTTRTPASYSRVAAPRVSSPPIATSASTPSAARLSLIRSTPDRPPALALSASGLVRDEPRIVPPRGRMPRTACTSRGTVSPSSGPRQPSRKPTNSNPNSGVPRRTSALMTAFNPGQSPPPVSTPTRIKATLVPMSVLAIDAGTTGVTALVVTEAGLVASRGYQEFRQYFPQPGWVEHLPEDIWQATLAACRQALDQAGGTAVSCIGITNQRETAVLWDRATLAAPRRAIVWQDRRTARICAQLREAGHEPRVAALTGLRLDPYFTGTKLTWLAEHEPATWQGLADGTPGRGHGGRLPDRADDRRRPARDGRLQRVPHAAVRHPGRPVVGRAVRAAPGAAAGAARGGARPPGWPRGPTRARSSAWRCRWPAWPAISRPRCSARPASPPATPSAPTAPGRSCWPTPAGHRPLGGWPAVHGGLDGRRG